MGTTVATIGDLWRLAGQAERNGVRVFVEPISGDWFATSASEPGRLHRVTGFSCTCRGFVAWQRCQHHAALLAHLGWLPDPEPPAAALPAPLAFPDREARADGLKAAVEGAVGRLADELAQGHTEGFLEALRFFARFHRYSARNCLLIRLQFPQASLIAGMRRWNELGYRIKAGESAIWIWAPILRKAKDAAPGDPDEELVGFRPAPVWDVSQLDGLDEKPLPSAALDLPDDAEAAFAKAKAGAEAAGIVVEVRPLPAGVDGASAGGRVFLRPGMGSREALLVLLHELAHEAGHKGEEAANAPVARRELEAESVAYVVAAAMGIAHPGARDYLLRYRATAEELRASLETIRRLAQRVLDIVEGVAEAEEALAA